MISINKSAIIAYSAEQMYHIVADIPAYPEFLQWCSGSKIIDQKTIDGNQHSEHDEHIVATVDIKYKGINQSFTTANANRLNQQIDMQLYDKSGPFDSLQGQWLFTDLTAKGGGSGGISGAISGSKVEFKLQFETQSTVLKGVFQSVFSYIANSQVDGFIKRAQQLYD